MPRLTPEQAARFERLAMPYLALLLRTVKYRRHFGQQAEDLVQQTMMKAMRGIDGCRDGSNIQAWLMTILRRAHIDAIRSNKRHAQEISLDQIEIERTKPLYAGGGEQDGEWTEPATLLERFGDRNMIEALQALPEKIRWTLLLVDVEQLDHAAAARILEVPVGTVKSRTHRGRAMLRNCLTPVCLQRNRRRHSRQVLATEK